MFWRFRTLRYCSETYIFSGGNCESVIITNLLTFYDKEGRTMNRRRTYGRMDIQLSYEHNKQKPFVDDPDVRDLDERLQDAIEKQPRRRYRYKRAAANM